MEPMPRDFKGIWIPREIWLDRDLTPLDKVILAEIDSLCSDESGCYASNDYLSTFCQCSSDKVTKAVKKLIEKGLIEQVSFDGRRRELRSCLRKITRLPQKKSGAASEKSTRDTLLKNNIDINIGSKSKTRSRKTRSVHGEFRHVMLSADELEKLWKEYGEAMTADYIRRVDEYCEQTGKRYKNYYLTICNWIRKDSPGPKRPPEEVHLVQRQLTDEELDELFSGGKK